GADGHGRGGRHAESGGKRPRDAASDRRPHAEGQREVPGPPRQRASVVKARRKPARGRPGARAAKIVWIGLAVITALAILVAVASSIFLHRVLATGKVKEWVNREPEKLRIEYESASGWNPWSVRVHGLELRSRDKNVEFWFRIEDARFSFSPLQLLTKRFHVGKISGSGLVYHLRIRSDPKVTEAQHFAALPP